MSSEWFGRHRRGDADPVAPGDFGRGPLEHTTLVIEVQPGNAGIEDEPFHWNTSSMPLAA
jgi:hypothetical protein